VSYTPEPDSLAARVCAWFQAHPDEELTGPDIARKFDLQNARGLHASLQPAVLAHWLALKQGGIYAPGRLLPGGMPQFLKDRQPPAPPARPNSVFPPKPERKKPLPPLDVSAINIESGVPVPENPRGPKRTDWSILLDRLNKPGLCSCPLPIERQGSLRDAAKKWAEKNPGSVFTVRAVSPTHVRIWRVEAAS
jgi:hypothetical protein